MVRKLATYLEIFGKDKTGKAFSSLTGNLDKVGKKAGGITASVFKGTLAANVATKALGASFTALANSAGAVGSAFSEASRTQDSLLAATASFSAIAGVGYDEAGASIERLNASLRESAKALPGATKDYNKVATGIVDNVIPAFRGLDGSINFSALEENTAALSESFTALGVNAGVQTSDIQKGLSKALSGKSIAELGKLLLFGENPAVLAKIEEKLAERTVESLKDLDISARVGLIREVGESFITDDFKDAAAQNVSGIVESFKTTLLDPNNGVFGLLRDTDLGTDGSQSVFEGYKQILKNLIGNDGILSPSGPLAGVLEALGIDLPDPMAFLYGLTQKVNNGLERVKGFLNGFTELQNEFGGVSSILKNIIPNDIVKDGVGHVTGAIGKGIAIFSEKLTDFLDKFDGSAFGAKVGGAASTGVIQLVKAIPWVDLGKALFRLVLEIGQIISAAIVEAVAGIAGEIGGFIANQTIGRVRRSLGVTAEDLAKKPSGSGGRRTSSPAVAAPITVSAEAKSRGANARSGRRTRNNAFGFDPPGSSPIMDAIAREMSQSPPGASPMISNSTERVIPAGAPGNDGQPLYRKPPAATGATGGSRVVNMSFAPTVQLPAGSTRQQAQELLRQLRELMGEEERALLV